MRLPWSSRADTRGHSLFLGAPRHTSVDVEWPHKSSVFWFPFSLAHKPGDLCFRPVSQVEPPPQASWSIPCVPAAQVICSGSDSSLLETSLWFSQLPAGPCCSKSIGKAVECYLHAGSFLLRIGRYCLQITNYYLLAFHCSHSLWTSRKWCLLHRHMPATFNNRSLCVLLN